MLKLVQQDNQIMKKYIFSIGSVVLVMAAISWYVPFGKKTVKTVEHNFAQIQSSHRSVPINNTTKSEIEVKNPPAAYEIPSKGFISQTYNNCGPATLAMVMRYFGKNVSQDTLRDQMRPFNTPSGGVDDKSVMAEEFVTYAQKYDLDGVVRPGGDITLLKTLVANNIPVVVRTLLHSDDDIGHFRIVRGYDDTRQVLIQDDSYQGANQEYSYDAFMQMWKPFDYGYILVYSTDQEALVKKILGDAMDEQTAYKAALQKNWNETDMYEQFNLSTAYYHLGQYQKSVDYYEKAQAAGLPPRTLWYQIEPIQAYLQVGDYDQVFTLTDWIFTNNNLAFSELYFLRGQADLAQNNHDAARSEFEKAVYYNQNYTDAQAALKSL
jgi:uncharacterized protein YvpB